MQLPRKVTKTLQQANVGRNLALPGLVATLALAVSVTGALFVNASEGGDGVNELVETLSGRSSSFLGGLGLLAPLGFAFVAGLVSAVNPCGFAMLPAYLGLYLGSSDQTTDSPHPVRHLGRALLVGGAVTAGFVVLFGVASAVIGLGARSFVAGAMPWLGLTVGVALATGGAWLLGGGKMYSGFAARLAAHMGDPHRVSVPGYFLFGLSYGTASLSCTLPFFLVAVGTTLAASSLLASFGQGVLFALGMGLVIMALTLGMALVKGAMMQRTLSRALPYIQPVGSLLMILAGAYLVFYWLTVGGLLRSEPG